ncbi:EAL domain-containing response regulator [Pseudomonas arsenicoxydans]|nr:EAL domain-containing protein [Pseudomonas arsenicoxydans]
MNDMKILILEDHALARHMLALTLRGLGYNHLFTAENGEQAFILLKAERHFDVLICDIQMEGVDGLSFLREAYEVGRIAALIISSGIDVDLRLAIQQLARLSGYQVLGDLDKPFSREDLKLLLARYRPAMPAKSCTQLVQPILATDVKRALQEGEFVPFYQPKINLQTLEVIGAEVLVRWQHPMHGLLAPGFFLDVVVREGGLDAMTQLITQQALGFLRKQRLIGEVVLSINLEASQLALPNLISSVQRALDSEGVPAASLILEITEGGLMIAPISSIENLVRLRLLGCGISIDDFGAGFSSLQRVCEMPCTELKLDASFIHSMPHNPRTLAAVDSLLHLAHKLDISLVAEGIETPEQLALLQDLGCAVGQGYLFSRPLSGDAFIHWLRDYNQFQAK